VAIREERGLELLDAGASRAFAAADHQVAHVYLNDKSLLGAVKTMLESTPGIALVLDDEGKRQYHLNHERAGDLVAVADKDAWFTYYYWLDDSRAPDFARVVDIHKKPGYDPVEMLLNPQITFPMLTVGWKLLQKKLGFRMLMDVIPLDASLIRGSHGRIGDNPSEYPVFISQNKSLQPEKMPEATEVFQLIWKHLFP
jgi:hypothetical protein